MLNFTKFIPFLFLIGLFSESHCANTNSFAKLHIGIKITVPIILVICIAAIIYYIVQYFRKEKTPQAAEVVAPAKAAPQPEAKADAKSPVGTAPVGAAQSDIGKSVDATADTPGIGIDGKEEGKEQPSPAQELAAQPQGIAAVLAEGSTSTGSGKDRVNDAQDDAGSGSHSGDQAVAEQQAEVAKQQQAEVAQA